MQGLVSVIIPVYNRQTYIKECLDSVLCQSYQNFEIVIVDDGSTDRSVEICKAIAESDQRIKLYEGEHAGVSAARNVALKNAAGEYMLFLDSDDILHSQLLEVLVSAMKETGAQIGGTFCYPIKNHVWNEKTADFLGQTSVSQYEHMSMEAALDSTFQRKTPISMIGGVMIRRDLIGDTKFRTDLSIGEDFWFIYENLIKGSSVVYLKKWLYMSRLHQSNTSWDYGYSGFMTRLIRKELVWENEEKCGRSHNADCQKSEVLGTYFRCLKRNPVYSKDARLMRKTLRKYQKTLWNAMRFKRKLVFLMAVYLPFTGRLFAKRKSKVTGRQ